MAEKAKKMGKLDESIKGWNKAAKLIPDLWIPHFRLGALFMEARRFEKSIEHLEIARQFNPNHTGINFFLGLNLTIFKKYDQSEYYFRRAIRSKPENPITYERLAYVLHQKKKFQGAEKNFKISLLLNPKFALAHLNFAALLAELKRHDEAITHLKYAIKLGLKTPMVNLLAKAYRLTL